MTTLYGYEQLNQVLAESQATLMVDRIEIAPELRTAHAVKAVSINEMFFQGHFPGAPIMPGVLQVAGMCQTAKALVRTLCGRGPESLLTLSAIHRLKFRKPVYPGDLLHYQVDLSAVDPTTEQIQFKAAALVNEEKTCEGTLTLSTTMAQQRTPSTLAPPIRHFAGDDQTDYTDVTGIMKSIPHRFPFLLIDRILHMDLETRRIIAVKNVTGSEPFFAGITTARMLPGYLMAEIAAQAGCSLALATPGNENKLAFFMSIDEAVLHAPVVPGDRLICDVKAIGHGRFGKGEGCLYVGDRLICDVSLKFAVMDQES